MKSTQTTQNIIARLLDEVVMEVEKPDIKMKRQFAKAMASLRSARLELDILNDMIEGE